MMLFYPLLENYAFNFIPGIRNADTLLERHTETPQFNVEAVPHAEKRLWYRV